MDIIVKGLGKYFQQGQKKLTVLDGINMRFRQKSTYAITGVSGTGKSTFLHILAGLDIPTGGSVLVGDKDITSLSEKEKDIFLNKKIGLVFQACHLISELTVLQNVIMPGAIAGKSIEYCSKRGLCLLHEVGIADKAYSYPRELSGGQQQRVAIARALFNEPVFLLADEPTGNLDIKTGKAIVDLIVQCSKKWNMGVIISSHDSYVAQNMEQNFRLEKGALHTV